MSTQPSYLNPQIMLDRWGPQTMAALFDDTGSGDYNADAMSSVIDGATERASEWLPNSYTGTLPFTAGTVPRGMVELALAYAKALAFERNPDFLRAVFSGKVTLMDVYTAADAMGERFQRSVLRMIDAAAPVPANVGGTVRHGDPDDETAPKKFFLTGTGDF